MSRSYKRKLGKFEVVFASKVIKIETLEGTVECKHDDAIVTGVEGEKWPVPRSIFDENYYPVNASLKHGQDGLYFRKEILVQAKKIYDSDIIELEVSGGKLLASKGDWLVTHSDGRQWIVADVVFKKTYTSIQKIKG